MIVAAVIVLFPSISTWTQQPHAQVSVTEDSEQRLEEEDLQPDSPSVVPEDDSVDDGADERRDEFSPEDEAFPHRDSRGTSPVPSEDDRTSLSSDTDASEDLPVMTSGPPPLPAATALGPREQVAVSFVAAGVEAMNTEDFLRARTLFERAIEIAPLQPYSYFFLGRLALARGEHQKALPLLRKADVLLIRGDRAWRSEAMSAQGAVYEDLGEIPQARKAYRKSLQLFPQNLRAMSALARLAEEEPDSDDTVSQ